MSETPVTEQPATAIGFAACSLMVILGTILGNVAAGAKTTIDSGYYSTETLTSYTTGTTGDGGFNWLIFSIFAATGLLALAVGACVGCITKNMPQRQKPPKAPTDPGYAA